LIFLSSFDSIEIKAEVEGVRTPNLRNIQTQLKMSRRHYIKNQVIAVPALAGKNRCADSEHSCHGKSFRLDTTGSTRHTVT
jgi:hypothetical protein